MATTLSTPVSTRDKLLHAKEAAPHLARLTTAEKNSILLAMADAIEAHEESILQANRGDAESSGLSGAMLDRLLLNPKRIKEMAKGIRDVANLPDPIDETLREWTR